MIPVIASDFALAALLQVRGTRADADDIERAVRRHCRGLGVTESDTVAAVNFALRTPGSTLLAIRAGNRRADQLRARAIARFQPTPA